MPTPRCPLDPSHPPDSAGQVWLRLLGSPTLPARAPLPPGLQVKRARAKQLKPDEYTTGTFTISNLGMFGVDSFSAILPAGEAGAAPRAERGVRAA